MADYEVGYQKPPKEHQFKKGRSGNPAGRKKKEKKVPAHPSLEAAEALKEFATERIEVRGQQITHTAALLRILYTKAAKGDMAAMRLYFSICEKTGLLERVPAADARNGGVLAVPMAIDQETWEYLAAKQQAKYRTSEPWNPENFILDPGAKEPGLNLDLISERSARS